MHFDKINSTHGAHMIDWACQTISKSDNGMLTYISNCRIVTLALWRSLRNIYRLIFLSYSCFWSFFCFLKRSDTRLALQERYINANIVLLLFPLVIAVHVIMQSTKKKLIYKFVSFSFLDLDGWVPDMEAFRMGKYFIDSYPR